MDDYQNLSHTGSYLEPFVADAPHPGFARRRTPAGATALFVAAHLWGGGLVFRRLARAGSKSLAQAKSQTRLSAPSPDNLSNIIATAKVVRLLAGAWLSPSWQPHSCCGEHRAKK
jgi:hypothetical protein